MNPVVAVLLGAAFVGERITATTAIGGLVTLLAVAVVVTEEGRRRRALLDAPVVAVAQSPTDRHGLERSSAT